MPRTFTIGSRASALAQIQSLIVRDALQTAHPKEDFGLSFMTTGGDKNQAQALYLLGGKALWTEELEDALIKGDIDIIVHSLKDVPTVLPDGCEIGAIMEREDPRDSLIVKAGLPYQTLEDLPDGSVVGTSSVRRVAQLRRAFPKLVFADVRGNLNTRLRKLDDPEGPFAAIILARAGLVRIDMAERITSDIAPPNLYHAVGQGALGIEIRSDDVEVKSLLRTLSHRATELRCRAERACLRVLEGGCSVPVGVDSHVDGNILTLTGTVTSLSGNPQVIHTLTAEMSSFDDAETLGADVGKALLSNGAKVILDEINKDRAAKAKRDEAKIALPPSNPVLDVPASEEGSIATEPSLSPFSTSSPAANPEQSRPVNDTHVDSFLNPKIKVLSTAKPGSPVRNRGELRRVLPGGWPEDDEVDEPSGSEGLRALTSGSS